MREKVQQWLQAVAEELQRYDPETTERLKSLSGHTLVLCFSDVEVTVGVSIGETGYVTVQLGDNEQADVKLTGTMLDFWRMGQLAREHRANAGRGIRIEGDIDVATRLAAIMPEAQIDWPALMQHYLGQYASGTLQAIRFISENVGGLVKFVDDSLPAWLEDTGQRVVPRRELDSFYSAVDQLNRQADKLEQQLKTLQEGSSS